MADLPDWYSWVEAILTRVSTLDHGADAAKSADPNAGDCYLATDTNKFYVCFAGGVWTDLTLAYLLLAGGTMTGDIAMGGNKVTGLGAPADQDDALRYSRAEIRNAEIAAAAAIVYSKLSLAASILTSDIAAAEFNAANKLVKLDASADVPDAQIPDLAASKITSERFPVDRLPDMTDEKIWKGTGGNVEEVDAPSKGLLQFGAHVTTTTGTRYAFSYGNGTASSLATETWDARFVCPVAGTVKNLRVSLDPNLSGTTLTVTVRKSGSDQALTCIVADGAGNASDTTHSFTVVAGEHITVSLKKSAATQDTDILASMEYGP